MNAQSHPPTAMRQKSSVRDHVTSSNIIRLYGFFMIQVCHLRAHFRVRKNEIPERTSPHKMVRIVSKYVRLGNILYTQYLDSEWLQVKTETLPGCLLSQILSSQGQTTPIIKIKHRRCVYPGQRGRTQDMNCHELWLGDSSNSGDWRSEGGQWW